MAKVIGFEEKVEEKPKIAVCPTCRAIIEYTQSDVGEFQAQGEYITCPNCKHWFLL